MTFKDITFNDKTYHYSCPNCGAATLNTHKLPKRFTCSNLVPKKEHGMFLECGEKLELTKTVDNQKKVVV